MDAIAANHSKAAPALHHVEAGCSIDNTLYPAQCDLFKQVDVRTANTSPSASRSPTTRRFLQKSFPRLRTTMRGLMIEYGIDPSEFWISCITSIATSRARSAARSRAPAARCVGREVRRSPTPRCRIPEKVLALGIRHHFVGIFDIVAAEYDLQAARRLHRFARHDAPEKACC